MVIINGADGASSVGLYCERCSVHWLRAMTALSWKHAFSILLFCWHLGLDDPCCHLLLRATITFVHFVTNHGFVPYHDCHMPLHVIRKAGFPPPPQKLFQIFVASSSWKVSKLKKKIKRNKKAANMPLTRGLVWYTTCQLAINQSLHTSITGPTQTFPSSLAKLNSSSTTSPSQTSPPNTGLAQRSPSSTSST